MALAGKIEIFLSVEPICLVRETYFIDFKYHNHKYFVLDAYLDIDICITISNSLIRELQVHQFSFFFFVPSYFNFSAGNMLKVGILEVAALWNEYISIKILNFYKIVIMIAPQ